MHEISGLHYCFIHAGQTDVRVEKTRLDAQETRVAASACQRILICQHIATDLSP